MNGMTQYSKPPRRQSCWFIGAVTLAVMLALLGTVAVLTYLMAKRTVNKAIAQYTSDSPMPIEQVKLPPARQAELERRVKAFQQALDDGNDAVELRLSGDEINALIAQNADFRGKVAVRIEGNQIKGKISLPLQDLGPLKLKGRYLNGEGAFKVALVNGILVVTLDDAVVNGQPLPEAFREPLSRRNLAEEMMQNPEVLKVIDKLDSIQVKDGQLILRTRGRKAESP